MVAVDTPTPSRTGWAPVSPLLFTGLTVAATGGPLALAALYVPGVLTDTSGSAGLVVGLGVLLFLPPLLVWLRYSRRVVGPAGLTGFVEAAAGRRVALVQAGLWTLSYLLYLVYTVTYIAYDVLPSVFPSLGSVRPLVEVVAAVVIAAVSLAPIRVCLAVIGLVAAGQLVLAGALAITGIGFHPLADTVTATGQTSDVLVAAGNTSILFVCASLPLFLGGEVRGGSGTVRRGLAGGWGVAAIATAAAVVPLAAAGATVLGADIPGVTLARLAGRPGLADAVGIGVAASIVGVIVAEFLALSRLGHALLRWPVRRLSLGLAAVLVGGSVVSLVDPQRVYDDLLKPSLMALWLAQVVVFVVYPRYAARLAGRYRVRDLALGGAAAALMLFGLWSTTVNQLGT